MAFISTDRLQTRLDKKSLYQEPPTDAQVISGSVPSKVHYYSWVVGEVAGAHPRWPAISTFHPFPAPPQIVDLTIPLGLVPTSHSYFTLVFATPGGGGGQGWPRLLLAEEGPTEQDFFNSVHYTPYCTINM